MEEFSIAKAIVDGEENGIFILYIPENTDITHAYLDNLSKHWEHTWRETVGKIPGLILLSEGLKLEALQDTKLRDLGLMRIPRS